MRFFNLFFCFLFVGTSHVMALRLTKGTGAKYDSDFENNGTFILVHYVYSGSDDATENNFRLENLDIFFRNAVTKSTKQQITYRVTISGKREDAEILLAKHNDEAQKSEDIPVVYGLTRENVGFDFGAHADMLQSESKRLGLEQLPYSAFIFLNDGTRGPFHPAYMPIGWHWTEAFTDKLTVLTGTGNVALVGTSLVCLPPHDAAVERDPSFYGPKVEGFAFAISGGALQYVRKHGSSFQVHDTKEDAVISGEYNLSRTVLLAPHKWSITSLLLAHQHVDFRDRANWDCNRCEKPSRSGKYGRISVSPLEVVFHKAHWYSHGGLVDNVSQAEFDHYSQWLHYLPAASYASHLP